MYVILGFFLTLVVIAGTQSLLESISTKREQRRVAKLPVVEGKCPLCGHEWFNSYGSQMCPGCREEVNVQRFESRCVFCGYGPTSYGPSICEECGEGLWTGTTVESYPEAKSDWGYLAMHGQLRRVGTREDGRGTARR